MEAVETRLRQLQQHDETVTLKSTGADEHDLPPAFLIEPREFEQILYASWVYRRTEHRSEMMSFNTSIARESAWSLLSECSLGDISILSVVALPVYISELSTGWTMFLSSDSKQKMNAAQIHSPEIIPRRPRWQENARRLQLQLKRKIAIVGSRSTGIVTWYRYCMEPVNSKAGKDSLKVKFVGGHYAGSDLPMIDTLNAFVKVIEYRGQEFATEIVDTTGQEAYIFLNNKHIIGVHGYMIVYSVACRQSFERVKTIIGKMCKHFVKLPHMLELIGSNS